MAIHPSLLLILGGLLALVPFNATVLATDGWDNESVITWERKPQLAYQSQSTPQSKVTYYQTQSPDVLYDEGIQAYRRGKYEEALALFRTIEQQHYQTANVQYYLAIILDKLDRPNDAMNHYRYVVNNGQDMRLVEYAKSRMDLISVEKARQNTARQIIQPVFGTRPDGATRVSLSPHKNALMVEAILDDMVSGQFIVDTGATYTSISKEMAKAIGRDNLKQIGTVTITTANGRIEVPKVLIKKISLNGLVARNVEATIIDVHKRASFSGLLGLSFIKQFKLTIDPQGGELVFQSL